MTVITARHIRAARALVGWSQSGLATKAKVGVGTIRRMERTDSTVTSRTDTVAKVVLVLEKAGVEFLNSGSPGVRLRATHAAAAKPHKNP